MLGLLLFAFIGGGLYYYFTQQTETVRVVSGDYLPDAKAAQKMTDEQIKEAEQTAVDASKFNMVIKPEAVFTSGNEEGDIYIQNPEHNAYPINVVIALNEGGKEVYSSGAIEPGYEVKRAVLDEGLDKGEYPATATFNIYDPVTKQKKGQVQASITISVLA
ncbi:hypothetical protein [Enterococcus larvae]|uniref:hypothetical protein n=1 Tax=Enterococcus larvae TaxID=2794352 RepID=UPI001FD7578E|nr:hypothetical protein [Enterococcus larvae]